MKRTLHSLVALVVAAAVPLVPLGAQNLSFFLGGGGAFPTGDLKDDGAETGWIGFAGVDMPIRSVPGAFVGVSGFYAHMPYEGPLDDATNVPGLFADVGYLFGATSPSRIKPYIRFGVGVLQHRYSLEGYNSDGEDETKVGGAVGAGLNFRMQSVTPFVGAHFITGGSDTSFLAAYVGLAFGGGSGSASRSPSLRR
jgi:opacity protein-like surface antigen